MAVLIRCSKCGNEIQEEGKFCPFCGNKLSVDEDRTVDSSMWVNAEYERKKQEYASELKRKAADKNEPLPVK